MDSGHLSNGMAVRRRLRWVFGIAAALVVGSGAGAYLNSNGILSTSIQPSPSLSTGAPVSVTAVDQTVTLTHGGAQTLSGLELYKVAVGDPALSGTLRVSFAWLDPQDAARVFYNPHAWLQVGLYDAAGSPSASGTCASGDYLINSGTLCVQPDPGGQAQAAVTRVTGNALLQSSTSGQSAVYVIAAIEVPKGNVPHGSQGNLSTLQFFCSVREGS